MAQQGMDVDLVETAGRAIQSDSQKLAQLISALDAQVNRLPSVWDGTDARAFVGTHWPQHKKTLLALVVSIDGLGQSALNNAREQRDASSVKGSSSSTREASASSTATTPGAETHSSGQKPTVAAPFTTSAASADEAARAKVVESFKAEWEGKAIDRDQNGRQCFDVFQQYTHEIFNIPNNVNVATTSDAASDIYRQYDKNGLSPYYTQLPADSVPQAGDVAVYEGTKMNGYWGHVAVVYSGGADFQVIQQNGNEPTTTVVATGSGTKAGTVIGFLRPKL